MSKNSGRILFVVLNFNGWAETKNCINSVLKQSVDNFNIMLIDNGSHDESLVMLKDFKKNNKIIFIEQPINLGFAGGVNVGIRYAIKHDYEYIVLLNNDAVITPQWTEILLKTLKEKKSSVVSGLLLSADGKKIDSTGDSYSNWGLPFPRQRGDTAEHAQESGFVFGGTAGASLYKTSLFEDIGLFDENFFAYYEDTDISFRAQLAGHKAFYESNAVAYHDHGTTSSKIPGFTVHQTFKNLPIFFWKNVPSSMLFSTGSRFFTYFLLIYIRALTRGQFLVATKGILKSIGLFPYALAQRHKIQKARRATLPYIRSLVYPGLPPNNKDTLNRIFAILTFNQK